MAPHMRILCLTTVLALITVLCSAQKEDDGRFDLPNGFRIGYQYSNLNNNDEDAADHLDRGYIGYVRKIKIVPLIHIETGLEYMIAGAQQSDDVRLQLHYLTVPAQGVLKLGPFVGVAGLNGNFRIAEDFTVDGEKVDRDDDDRAAAFDLAVDAGAGFNILFMTIEARYYWGLLEVDNGWYNRYWQAGLKFHF